MEEHAAKVQWECMLPHELEAAMAACPTAFVPLGTLEWHGRQNAVGLDALKAHALCVRAARAAGGVVLPSLYGGIGGIDQPFTVVIEPEPTLVSRLLVPWLESLCGELKRIGFRAAILLTGHYGASQQMLVRETALRQTQRLDIPILGTPEYFLAIDVGYTGDHAASFETSLMMELLPELVDLSQLTGDPPYQGVHGADPKRESSRELGARFAGAIVERLARLARRMPEWDAAEREGFLRAEQAMVSYQLELAGRTGQDWAAWRDVPYFGPYAGLLADERFAEIVDLVHNAPRQK